jgi:hypothetical protein
LFPRLLPERSRKAGVVKKLVKELIQRGVAPLGPEAKDPAPLDGFGDGDVDHGLSCVFGQGGEVGQLGLLASVREQGKACNGLRGQGQDEHQGQQG